MRWVVFSLLWGALCAPLFSQESIWAERILSQPFEERFHDGEPFHAVRIPSWLEETIGCGYTLSGMDAKARAAAVRHGVTISEMGFVDPYYPYYDSKLLKRRSPHVPLERIKEEIAEYKRLGIRILAVYPPCLQGEVYENHPDWRRIPTNTTEIPSVDLKEHPYGGMLCLLGPYGDFFADVLCEILEQHPEVDAYSFDGLHYAGVCYCQHCRAAYRADTGEEIPDPDLNNPAFRRYQHWADRKMEDVVRKVQKRLKAIKPDVALVTWTTNAGRFGHFLSIPRNMPARMNLLLDAPDQEFWLDETNRGATIIPAFANAYIWATTNHRVAFSEPYLMSHGNPYGKDSFPPHEIERRMMLALTYGAAPSIAVAQPPQMQEALYAIMDQVQRRKEWLTHKKPEPWAAIVMSDNTRNFYGRAAGLVEERYLASVLGTFRACVEEHLPVAVINDWNLTAEELAKYAVVILPNTACLDDRQVAGLREYVENGGGLVATLDTSLFDEFGSPRENFGLAEVFGVDYAGPATAETTETPELDVNFAKALGPDYFEKRKSIFDFRLPSESPLLAGKLKTYIADQPVTFKGPAIRVRPKGEEVRSETLLRPRTSGAAEFPAIVRRDFGKGRVIYLGCGLDAAYYLYSYPYQRIVLANAIRAAAAKAPPVEIEAPMCVHTTVMRQSKKGERLVVHLYNNINTTAHHAYPVDDVPLREETVPIHDIRVRFRGTQRIKSFHLEPDHIPLEPQRDGDDIVVLVKRLDVHAMVVAELEE